MPTFSTIKAKCDEAEAAEQLQRREQHPPAHLRASAIAGLASAAAADVAAAVADAGGAADAAADAGAAADAEVAKAAPAEPDPAPVKAEATPAKWEAAAPPKLEEAPVEAEAIVVEVDVAACEAKAPAAATPTPEPAPKAAPEPMAKATSEVPPAPKAEAPPAPKPKPPPKPPAKPYVQVSVFCSRQDQQDEAICNFIGSYVLHNHEVGNEREKSVFVCPECPVSKEWLGFGGAFTEASCMTLQRLSDDKQDEVLRAYFDVETGLGYTMGRVHIGSCDFSLTSWTCGEISQTDKELNGFSISRYRKAIVPMLKKAAQIANRRLDILASPWTPFPWMKTEPKFNSGGLKPEYFGLWAKHFIRFIQEFSRIGVPIWGVSVQNEPASAGRWESCIWTAEEERDFVRDHLGPGLQQAGLESVRIIVGDHNRDGMLERAAIIYGDPEAAKYIWGVGYHWYGDARFEAWADFQVVPFTIPQLDNAPLQDIRAQVCFENVRRVAELRPDKHIIFTEGCQELNGAEVQTRLDDWKLGERYAMNIIADMNSGCEGWIDWNLCLNSRGGPNHARNFCMAPFIIDHDRILTQPCYWFLLHFSRFIRPGARRVVCSSSRDALEVTAWINPGDRGAPGTTADNVAVVVLNQTDQDMDFWLKVSGAGAMLLMAPAHSINTLVIERESP